MTLPDFVNEPLTDFSVPANREAFVVAMQRVSAERAREYLLVVGGERMATGRWIESVDPSEHTRLAGRVAQATQQEAERALDSAWGAFPDWSRVPGEDRAAIALRAASLMRARRHELSAVMVIEVGKNWIEADADTAEAIDFLEYYAREAIRLDGDQPLVPLRGTRNSLRYLPLGVGLAIPPWNFPLAIATGLVSSAILAGNTVVFKPASVAPVIAARLVDLLEEAGLPPGVVNFLPGPGSEVGDYLVGHPRIRFISFTGSRDVGLHINELAAHPADGQRWIKRVVAEMGGKDAIVVDATADLEQAAQGIVASAFGYQGQKCSACSRVIADARVYDEVVRRVVDRARLLRVGAASQPDMDLGPVVDRSQFDKVRSYQSLGTDEARLVLGGTADDSTGYFVQPTIFADAPPDSRLMQEEIFGPVLAMTPARDFEEALRIANNTVYGLTGGVYSRDRYHLRQAEQEFQVGNLYLNRKITGALVGVEPFGGFNLSGTDSKAGGPDYLKLFMEAKAISERL